MDYKIIYDEKLPLKGIIQIIHGMSEYSMRYLDFSEYLNSKGYGVVLSDHLNHGENAYKNNTLGYFEDSFEVLVKNQMEITEDLREKYPNIPLYILGHSMGSFIGQEHMKHMSYIVDKYIFMGSCGERKLIVILGKYLFKLVSIFIKKPKLIFNKILFGKFKEDYSWLMTDKIALKEYLDNPLCGFPYVPTFYYNFLDFLSNLYKKESFSQVRKNIPLLIISGEKDPIGLYGKGVKNLCNFYENLNFTRVVLKLYSDEGHEILNGLKKKEVYDKICNFLG